MSAFEFVFSLFGLLLGFSLGEPLGGLGKVLKSRRDIRVDARARFGTVAGWSLPIVAAALLASCKTPEHACVAPGGLSRLTVTAEPGANGGLATEIDLVFVTDKNLYEAIGGMTARDYFAKREQMARDFPNGFRTRSFALEPTQRQIAHRTEPPCNSVGALLFVNYDNDRPNRIRLGKEKAGTLALGPDDFTWSATDGAAEAPVSPPRNR